MKAAGNPGFLVRDPLLRSAPLHEGRERQECMTPAFAAYDT
jgi:hypothetical protein